MATPLILPVTASALATNHQIVSSSATLLLEQSSTPSVLLASTQVARKPSPMVASKSLQRCQLATGYGQPFGMQLNVAFLLSLPFYPSLFSLSIHGIQVHLHFIFSRRMLPQDSVYGVWPKSGEVDIAESRGNSPETYNDGRDTVYSALHWGLSFNTDMFLQTNNQRYIRRTDYSQGFHTFGLEWSQNYLYTYVDNRLLQVLSVGFGGENMWARSGLSAEGYS